MDKVDVNVPQLGGMATQLKGFAAGRKMSVRVELCERSGSLVFGDKHFDDSGVSREVGLSDWHKRLQGCLRVVRAKGSIQRPRCFRE